MVFYTLFLLLACQYGFFGQDCTKTCNDRCDGCNNINGLCESGCLKGWMGNDCRKGINNSVERLTSFICFFLWYLHDLHYIKYFTFSNHLNERAKLKKK